jgi:hypothetical protein
MWNRRGLSLLLMLGMFGMAASVAVAMDYEPKPLTELIGTSDLIVEGTIARVGSGAFSLRASNVLVGHREAPVVEVARFAYWPGTRWADYAADQTALLFLRKATGDAKTGGANWEILGVAGEGEMPADGEAIYITGLRVPGMEEGTYRVGGVDVSGQRVAKRGFFDALKGYRKCFAWKHDPTEDKQWRVESRCDAQQLEGYRRKSALHEYLVASTQARIAR